jgi:hypothetical protein
VGASCRQHARTSPVQYDVLCCAVLCCIQPVLCAVYSVLCAVRQARHIPYSYITSHHNHVPANPHSAPTQSERATSRTYLHGLHGLAVSAPLNIHMNHCLCSGC